MENHRVSGLVQQHMPVKVRIEGHEELLCGSSHAGESHYTVSPAAERLSRVFSLGSGSNGVGHVHVRCNWLFGTPHPCGGFGAHSGEGACVILEINIKVDDISKY